jgi:CBS domain-containing protein
MKVEEIMTTDVVSVQADSEIEDAARLMANHRISGLPVMDQANNLVGLVTEYDLISKQGRTVGDLMTRGIISITPETDVSQVAELLASRRIRRVPVMQGTHLVGIVSRSDLIKQLAMRWVCHVCGEAVRSEQVPQHCPSCGAHEEAFSHEAMMPGM